MRHWVTFLTFLCALSLPGLLFAMTSTTYQIPRDSLNVGGGYGSSTTYRSESTVGEVGTGYSSSTSFAMHAGFQQMDAEEVYITITSDNDIALSAINGLTGGTSDGEGEWNVETNNNAGYTLYIRAGTSPALKGLIASFADYTPSGADPDYTFAVAASSAEFGFSPEGDDIVDRFRDNGAVCNSGLLDTSDSCWDGLTTSDVPIAQSGTANEPDGATTTVKFRAQSGSSNIQENDAYSASITVTAITL